MKNRLLAQPLALKHHVLKNRIIMGSMHTGFEEHTEGAAHLAAFYAQRAQGGVALIITGGISPNEEGAVVDGGAKLTNAEEVAWHKIVTDAVHQHGAKICMQILHTGRYAQSRQPVAPSAIRAPINQATPRALTETEIKKTVDDYIQCALLAKEAGYDGVEVMGSEGYLINQFLVEATNHRTDTYGGSVENRQRFAMEIVKGIRQACGEDFLLIYRISLLDLVADGSRWKDTELLAQKIQQAGVDIFNTGIGWHEARIPTIATCVPRGAFADATAKLKSISSIPVVAVNRINMPEVAESILQSGQSDAVCLARPLLADPEWANKAIKQQDNSINTCIACNQACLDHIFAGKLVSCLVNPYACHELQLISHATNQVKKLAVVGAGPSGLAFAIEATKRGHQVSLFDRQAEIGGQLNIAKNIPGKPEFHEIIRYFQHELNRLEIPLFLGQEITGEELKNFDEIILASGILPREINIEGSERENVYSYLDVLKDKKEVGSHVAIIGTGGIGFDVAEYLSHSGQDSALSIPDFLNEWQIDMSLEKAGGLLSEQPIISPSIRQIYLLQRSEGVVGRNLGKTTGWIHRLVLKYKQIKMLSGVTYQKVDDEGLHIMVNNKPQVIPIDTVVVCAGQVSDNRLEEVCKQLNKPVHLIGGAKDARKLDAKGAILSGTQLALEI